MIDSIDVDSCGDAELPANSFAYSLSMAQGHDPTRSKEMIEDILMEAIDVFQQVRKHD